MFNWEMYREKGINFVNVGIWNSKKDFLREMDKMPEEIKKKIDKFKWGETKRV